MESQKVLEIECSVHVCIQENKVQENARWELGEQSVNVAMRVYVCVCVCVRPPNWGALAKSQRRVCVLIGPSGGGFHLAPANKELSEEKSSHVSSHSIESATLAGEMKLYWKNKQNVPVRTAPSKRPACLRSKPVSPSLLCGMTLFACIHLPRSDALKLNKQWCERRGLRAVCWQSEERPPPCKTAWQATERGGERGMGERKIKGLVWHKIKFRQPTLTQGIPPLWSLVWSQRSP